MYVLGIETSCDETAASVVKDGKAILSNVIASSLNFHKKYGGVVPEIAFRRQLETISQVADAALRKSGIKLSQIGLISVTSGPGLLGSLLVGISFAKATSFSLRLPLLGVNHLHSHIYSAFLRPQKRKISAKNAEFPFVALVASGGHTSLFYAKDFDEIKILGSTQDDACGEAFDKVAKILNLGYPGGPLIEKLAKKGNPHKIKFGCSDTNNPLDFSFSGIKTAVLYYVRRLASSPVSAAGGSAFGGSQLQMRQTGKSRMKQIYEGTLRDPEATLKKSLHSGQANRQTKNIAASFQQTVIDTLIRKSLLACRMKESKRLVLGGGVLANSRLREDFLREANRNNINLYLPPRELCTDNAAMVAGLGYQLFRRGHCSELDLSADPVAPLQK